MTELKAQDESAASPVCFGCMQFGGTADAAASQAMYAACRGAGVNFFDTAHMYTDGAAEELLGGFVAQESEQLIIATKAGYTGGSGRANILAQIDESGAWSVSLPNVDPGTYTLRVDQVATEGDVTSRVETPFLREEPEVIAALPALQDNGVNVITVQTGNTLWGIARDRYVEGQLYVQVFEANRDQIRDPDLIYPGQIFTIPELQ